MSLTLIACTGCGASLPVDVSHLSVECAFCGSTCEFEAGDLADHAAMPKQASAAESEGLTFLRIAYEQSFRPGAPGALLAILLAIEAWMVGCFGFGLIGAFAEFFLGDGYSEIFAGVGALCSLLCTIIPFAILGWAYWAAPKRGEQAVEAIADKVEKHPRKSSCPSCGGPVQVPPLSAALPCCSCGCTLLVSRGMLIEWVDDAKARKERWLKDASAVAREYSSWTVRWTNRIGWAMAAAMFLTSAVCFVLLQLAGSALIQSLGTP